MAVKRIVRSSSPVALPFSCRSESPGTLQGMARVRSGQALALDYWPEAAQRLRCPGWPKVISVGNAKCPW